MVWKPFTRAQHDRNSLRYASDLTDDKWVLLASWISPQSKEMGQPSNRFSRHDVGGDLL